MPPACRVQAFRLLTSLYRLTLEPGVDLASNTYWLADGALSSALNAITNVEGVLIVIFAGDSKPPLPRVAITSSDDVLKNIPSPLHVHSSPAL